MDRMEFSEGEVLFLAKVCDVSRLRYVNPTFCNLLLRSSYDTVRKLKSADYKKLYQELKEINKDNK